MRLWSVEWTKDAEADIGRLLYSHNNRREIMAAADAIEKSLKEHPYDVGESREGDHRIVIESPVAVYCHVYQERFVIEIYAVWYWGN